MQFAFDSQDALTALIVAAVMITLVWLVVRANTTPPRG